MIYKRKKQKNAAYYIDLRWADYSRIQQSTGTTNKKLAEAFEATLLRLREQGKREALQLLASGQLKIRDVYDASLQGEEALRELLDTSSATPIGVFLDEWYVWLKSPATVAPHSHRRYSLNTVCRYDQSWRRILLALPGGRSAPLGSIDNAFLKEFRRVRIESGTNGATVNRDLNTIRSFFRFLDAEKAIRVPMLRFPRESESYGSDRSLTPEELAALQQALPPSWRPLFDLLVRTGMRIGEAQGLTWKDVHLSESVIWINDNENRRLKTPSSYRRVPISDELARTLVQLAKTEPSDAPSPVFPGQLGDYRKAYRAFKAAAKKANVLNVRIHDLRHTCAVLGMANGVPLARMQRLLGHATPAMTLRYARQQEGSGMREDASAIDAGLAVRMGGDDTKGVASPSQAPEIMPEPLSA